MFENKVVVILGATGGIGQVLTKEFYNSSAKIVAVGRNQLKLENLTKDYPKIITKKIDVTIEQEIQQLVSEIEEKYEKIDILIHAVGSIFLKPLHLTKTDEFIETLQINLISPFIAIKAVLKGMLKQKQGSIVVISSVAGSKGIQNHEAISAAKGGLEAMIRSSAITYAKRGIRLNAVALGMIDTPLSERFTSNERSLQASIEMHPIKRIGTPEDVVEAVKWLSSDRSSFVTGAIIPIDGGMKAS